jgi:glycosyltransferase involved in cell wall biosynthesis
MALSFNHFIAMSQATRKKLANLGVNEKDVTVIYGGVEFAKMNKDRGEKDVRPTIVSISRLLKYKRLSDLVRAVAEVKKNHPLIRCLIIGEGPEKSNLQLLIRSTNLQKNVELLENMPHDEAMVRLKRAHLFCLPSVVEGFGLVTVEAMAAGVPFVSAGIPATREITENGKGGLLFEPENVIDLAKKLNMLLDDKILHGKKMQEGIKLAKRYDWDIIAMQTEAVYQKVIDSHSSKIRDQRTANNP